MNTAASGLQAANCWMGSLAKKAWNFVPIKQGQRNRAAPTPTSVATWMSEELKAHDVLYQSKTVYDIEEIFGETFVYENENGNLAISRAVLAEFRRLTESSVVWDRSE
jgi:3-methyladenine DNA glycosylase Tag